MNPYFNLTDEHLKNFCLAGGSRINKCRFLDLDGHFFCTKYTPRGMQQEGIGNNLGDNCDAFLDSIMKDKMEFIGKKAMYIKYVPKYLVTYVEVLDLIFDKENKLLFINIKTEESTFLVEMETDCLLIINQKETLEFSCTGQEELFSRLQIFKNM